MPIFRDAEPTALENPQSAVRTREEGPSIMDVEKLKMVVEKLKVKKDLLWNIFMFAVTMALLGLGYFLSAKLIHDGQPLTDSLKIIIVAQAIPVFFLVTAYNRISSETVGVTIGAIIGFALGKIGG